MKIKDEYYQTISSQQFVNARTKNQRIFGITILFLMVFLEPKINSQYMFWIGYVLVITGALGRIYSSIYIGGRKGKMLIEAGPFSVVRNPLYVFSFIAFIGISLQSSMLTITVIVLGSFCWYYPKIVQHEELYLREAFGDQYSLYAKKVRRWVPRLKLYTEPEWIDVRLSFIRRTLVDTAFLFIPGPLFLFSRMLHKHSLLYFHLP